MFQKSGFPLVSTTSKTELNSFSKKSNMISELQKMSAFRKTKMFFIWTSIPKVTALQWLSSLYRGLRVLIVRKANLSAIDR